MKYLIFILLALPVTAQAHCPNEVSSQGVDYCVDVIWDLGERKVRGQFEMTNIVTPYLIPMGEIPQRWIYSRAIIVAWQKGDKTHSPVEIPGFRIFPYMHMENGHHHSASYDFVFQPGDYEYTLSKLALQEMRGCWSLRWTTDTKDEKSTSQRLVNITEYTNIAPAKVIEQESFCEKDSDGHGGDHGDHHHH